MKNAPRGECDEKSFSGKGRYLHSLLNNNNNDKFLLCTGHNAGLFFFNFCLKYKLFFHIVLSDSFLPPS